MRSREGFWGWLSWIFLGLSAWALLGASVCLVERLAGVSWVPSLFEAQEPSLRAAGSVKNKLAPQPKQRAALELAPSSAGKMALFLGLGAFSLALLAPWRRNIISRFLRLRKTLEREKTGWPIGWIESFLCLAFFLWAYSPLRLEFWFCASIGLLLFTPAGKKAGWGLVWRLKGQKNKS